MSELFIEWINVSLYRITLTIREMFEDTKGVIRRYQRGNQKPQIDEGQNKFSDQRKKGQQDKQ